MTSNVYRLPSAPPSGLTGRASFSALSPLVVHQHHRPALRLLSGHATQDVPVRHFNRASIEAEELALAASIQARLMSVALPYIPYASVVATTIPCKAVGGDFYDAVLLDDCVYGVVADVSGKGVPAAIVAAMLQGIIHTQMLANEPQPRIAASVNQFLCSKATGKYATMVLFKVSAGGKVAYLNCGHVPPVLVRDGNVTRLEGANVVVGLLPYAEYRSEQAELRPGDRVLIFTDGITEAENAEGEQFSDCQLELLARDSSVGQVIGHVCAFTNGADQADDWTILQLRFKGLIEN